MTSRKLRFFALLMLTMIMILVAATAFATDGHVNTNKLVLRKAASKNSKALQTLDKGDRLDIKEVCGDWYKVSYGKYSGYVMAVYVTVSGPLPNAQPVVTPAPAVNSNTTSTSGSSGSASASASTSVTLRVGDNNSSVKAMQSALQTLGYYSGKIDGIFGSGTENAVRTFQRSANLKQDGVAGPKTLGALYGANPPSASASSVSHANGTKTESLDWFKDGNSAIPRGAVFTVKDVDTGKTFQVKRWAGSSHCDSEPLTKDDTATMKAIYGGNWSWTRRAILVSYNGHVYAASMNGQPHGTSNISNNFAGHFCIHFTGSKTHGTDKVDPDHQAAVQKALNSTW